MKLYLLSILLWICELVVLNMLYIHGVAIDNGVEGDPEVSCGATSITVAFLTRNPFGGHIYAKGRFAEGTCRFDGDQSAANRAIVTISFDTCGVKRSRAVNPKGLLMSVTVLIMFHTRFMTKVDRAYFVQCFYMESEKSVTAELDISMIPTQGLTAQAPMPICRYVVLDSKGGQPVRYAKVGDQVHHRWTCESTIADAYCMVVHTCIVDDGSGNTVTLIDSNGCAQDQYLLGNLEYYDDLAAGRDSHVFKYADKSSVSFNCQVTVAPREQNLPCPRPSCSLEPAPTYEHSSTLPPPPVWVDKKSRVRRLVGVDDRNGRAKSPPFGTIRAGVNVSSNQSNPSVMDVEAQSILVFDLDSRLDSMWHKSYINYMQ